MVLAGNWFWGSRIFPGGVWENVQAPVLGHRWHMRAESHIFLACLPFWAGHEYRPRRPSSFYLVAVRLLSRVWLFVTPWPTASQAPLFSTISQSLLKFMSIESVMLSNHLIFCQSLLLLPSVFPSIRVLSNELALRIRWPRYWSFIVSISPSNAYSGLISFRMDWFISLKIRVSQKSSLGPQFKSIKKLFSFWY